MRLYAKATFPGTAATCVVFLAVFGAQVFQCGSRSKENALAQVPDQNRTETLGTTADRKPQPKPNATTGSCNIPNLADISEIVAETYCHPLGAVDIRQFNVPPDEYETLLKYFDGSREVVDPTSDQYWSEIGSFRVVMKKGGCFRFCWYMNAAKARLHFSCAGRRFIKTGRRFAEDENLTVTAFVRGLSERVKNK